MISNEIFLWHFIAVRSECLYVLFCLVRVYHHHDSYCTCNFVLAVFCHFIHLLHHCTNYICKKRRKRWRRRSMRRKIKTLLSCACVCWWLSNLPSVSSEINRNAITLRYTTFTFAYNIDLERIFFILIMCMLLLTCKQSACLNRKTVFRCMG